MCASDESQVDKYVLHELSQLENDAVEAYDAFAFNRGDTDLQFVRSNADKSVLQSTTGFISATLSSFYFDAVKDTLYCQVPDSPDRLAVVATLCEVCRILLGMKDVLTGRRYRESFERSSLLSPHI